jgi:hypothetical protein
MSNLKRVLLIVVGFGSLALMSACGNTSNTAAAAAAACPSGYTYNSALGCQYTGVTTGTTTGACSAGYAWSASYNTCLQQNSACSGIYGIYNGSCVLLTATNTAATNNPYQGTCSAGLVQTSYGCLQQGACSIGYGFGYWAGTPYCFPSTANY